MRPPWAKPGLVQGGALGNDGVVWLLSAATPVFLWLAWGSGSPTQVHAPHPSLCACPSLRCSVLLPLLQPQCYSQRPKLLGQVCTSMP